MPPRGEDIYLLSWHCWCEGGWGVTRPKLVAAADLKKIVVWSWNDDGSDTQVTEDHGVKREQSANHTSLWYSAFDQKHTRQGMVISKPILLRPKIFKRILLSGAASLGQKNIYPVGLIPWFGKKSFVTSKFFVTDQTCFLFSLLPTSHKAVFLFCVSPPSHDTLFCVLIKKFVYQNGGSPLM